MKRWLKYLLLAVCIYPVLAIFVLERDFFPTGVENMDISTLQRFHVGNFQFALPDGFALSSYHLSVDKSTIEEIPNLDNKNLEAFWGPIAESKRRFSFTYADMDLGNYTEQRAYAMCYNDGTGGYTINSFFQLDKMVLNISESRVYPYGEPVCTDMEKNVLKVFAHYKIGVPTGNSGVYRTKYGYLLDYPAKNTHTVASIKKRVDDPTRHFVITVETRNELWVPPSSDILALNALAVPWEGFFSSVRNGERQFAGLPGKEFLVITSEKGRKTLLGEWTSLKTSPSGLAVQASLDAPDTHKAEALKAWDVFLGSIELLQ